MNLQAMMDGMSAQWAKERAATQMALGKLIDRLSEMDPAMKMQGIHEPHSYRGYYSDLAFQSGADATVAETLALCRSAMGEVFQGYKGGDFQMGRNTPVWVASYGHTGKKIMAVRDDGSLDVAEDE